jgi:hypothetical protein
MPAESTCRRGLQPIDGSTEVAADGNSIKSPLTDDSESDQQCVPAVSAFTHPTGGGRHWQGMNHKQTSAMAVVRPWMAALAGPPMGSPLMPCMVKKTVPQ